MSKTLTVHLVGLRAAHSYEMGQGAFNVTLMYPVIIYEETWELTFVLNQRAPPYLPSCPAPEAHVTSPLHSPEPTAQNPPQRALCILVQTSS